jgi:hypothetical protein
MWCQNALGWYIFASDNDALKASLGRRLPTGQGPPITSRSAQKMAVPRSTKLLCDALHRSVAEPEQLGPSGTRSQKNWMALGFAANCATVTPSSVTLSVGSTTMTAPAEESCA